VLRDLLVFLTLQLYFILVPNARNYIAATVTFLICAATYYFITSIVLLCAGLWSFLCLLRGFSRTPWHGGPAVTHGEAQHSTEIFDSTTIQAQRSPVHQFPVHCLALSSSEMVLPNWLKYEQILSPSAYYTHRSRRNYLRCDSGFTLPSKLLMDILWSVSLTPSIHVRVCSTTYNKKRVVYVYSLYILLQ